MNKKLKENSAVQTHINILQNIITRMAGNSANCKTWAITIITAVVVLLIDKNKMDLFFLTFIPLVIFYILDCFYLGLEREFKNLYNNFIEKLNSDKLKFEDIYKIQLKKGFFFKLWITIKAFKSFSTTPLYLIIGLLIFFFKIFN